MRAWRRTQRPITALWRLVEAPTARRGVAGRSATRRSACCARERAEHRRASLTAARTWSCAVRLRPVGRPAAEHGGADRIGCGAEVRAGCTSDATRAPPRLLEIGDELPRHDRDHGSTRDHAQRPGMAPFIAARWQSQDAHRSQRDPGDDARSARCVDLATRLSPTRARAGRSTRPTSGDLGHDRDALRRRPRRVRAVRPRRTAPCGTRCVDSRTCSASPTRQLERPVHADRARDAGLPPPT